MSKQITRYRSMSNFIKNGDILWTPQEIIDDVLLWYDISDLDTITESGGLVSNIKDKSKNGYDLEQLGGVRQPTLVLDGLNGKPAILCNSSTWFTLSGLNISLNNFQSAQAVKLVTYSPFDTVLILSSTTTSDALQLGRQRDTLEYHVRANNGTAWSTSSLGNNTLIEGKPSLQSASWDGSTLSALIDGLTDGTPSLTGTIDVDEIEFPNNGQGYIGYIGEIVIVKSADSNIRQKLEGYLAHRRGMKGNLAIGHPYFTNPPLK